MTTPSHAPSPLSLKRPSSASDTGATPSKKQKRHYHHTHRLERPLDVQVPGAAFGDEPSVDQLLTSSIGLVLSNAGFEYAEAVALDATTRRVEECMLSIPCSLECVFQFDLA